MGGPYPLASPWYHAGAPLLVLIRIKYKKFTNRYVSIHSYLSHKHTNRHTTMHIANSSPRHSAYSHQVSTLSNGKLHSFLVIPLTTPYQALNTSLTTSALTDNMFTSCQTGV